MKLERFEEIMNKAEANVARSICVCHSIAWTSKGYRTANLSDEFDALLNPKNRRYGAYYLEQSSSKKSRDVRHTALLLFEQHALQHKIYKEV